MKLIALARLLIADKEVDNFLFTDDEITYLINRNIVHMVLQAESVDVENKIFDYGTYEVLPGLGGIWMEELEKKQGQDVNSQEVTEPVTANEQANDEVLNDDQDPYNVKIYSPDGILIDASQYVLNTQVHRVEFNQPTNYLAIVIDCDVIDIDNLRADAMELIAVDFRKLHNYSIQNVNGNLETAKEHVLRLARFFRRPRLRGVTDV